MSDESACCAWCGTAYQVNWCPAWSEWLCPNHRLERTWRDLDATNRPDGWYMAQAKDVAVVTL